MKKNAVAFRIKEELLRQDLKGTDLARLTPLTYHDVNNILSGKSSKKEKIQLIAEALGKPLEYFTVNLENNNPKQNESEYNEELHCKLIQIISIICRENKISLTQKRMNLFANICYPRINKDDPEDLISAQILGLIKYALKNEKNLTDTNE